MHNGTIVARIIVQLSLSFCSFDHSEELYQISATVCVYVEDGREIIMPISRNTERGKKITSCMRMIPKAEMIPSRRKK